MSKAEIKNALRMVRADLDLAEAQVERGDLGGATYALKCVATFLQDLRVKLAAQ